MEEGSQADVVSRTLLKEYKDDVDVLTIPAMDGIEQVTWVMRKVMDTLKGKIIEIGIDTTCKR